MSHKITLFILLFLLFPIASLLSDDGQRTLHKRLPEAVAQRSDVERVNLLAEVQSLSALVVRGTVGHVLSHQTRTLTIEGKPRTITYTDVSFGIESVIYGQVSAGEILHVIVQEACLRVEDAGACLAHQAVPEITDGEDLVLFLQVFGRDEWSLVPHDMNRQTVSGGMMSPLHLSLPETQETSGATR
jgi:hypothetical protein